MKQLTTLLAVAIAMVVTGLSHTPAQAVDLRMISAWDERYLPVEIMAEEFIDEVNAKSDGQINITRSGPEVVSALEQLQPVGSGAFDLLFGHGGYHAGTTGIALALDTIAPDPDKRREAGVWDFVDQHYREQHNLKLIALPVAGSQGYQIFLREPLSGNGLEGRKIRGTTVYHNLIQQLGGSPVVLGGPEIYSALDKGVVDGAAWAMLGGVNFKWYEVAPYIARPTFGVSTHILFMNLDAWNELSASQQQLLLEEGRQLEHDAIKTFNKVIEEEVATLKSHGVEETRFSQPAEQIQKYWNDGVWDVAMKAPTAADAKAMRELALEAGLTK